MPLQGLSTRALNWDNVGDFWLYYAAIFNAWIGQAFFNNRFDTDDGVAKLFALAKMTCVVGMAAGVPRDINTDGGELFVVSYCMLRFLLIVEYLRTAAHVREARSLALRFVLGFTAASSLWLASLALPRGNILRYPLVLPGLV